MNLKDIRFTWEDIEIRINKEKGKAKKTLGILNKKNYLVTTFALKKKLTQLIGQFKDNYDKELLKRFIEN